MYTEIDVDNADGELVPGMYGNVTITLEPAPKDALTVPSLCVTERDENGKGVVYVVRDGKVHRVEVTVGKDDGIETEILAGLKGQDSVVARYTGSIAEGLVVRTTEFVAEHEQTGGEPTRQ